MAMGRSQRQKFKRYRGSYWRLMRTATERWTSKNYAKRCRRLPRHQTGDRGRWDRRGVVDLMQRTEDFRIEENSGI